MPCDFDKKKKIGPFSLEIKFFSTKLYFTSILILKFEKGERA
jgi:hypothetical protein